MVRSTVFLLWWEAVSVLWYTLFFFSLAGLTMPQVIDTSTSECPKLWWSSLMTCVLRACSSMKWREMEGNGQLSFLYSRDFYKQQFSSLFELRIWGYYQNNIVRWFRIQLPKYWCLMLLQMSLDIHPGLQLDSREALVSHRFCTVSASFCGGRCFRVSQMVFITYQRTVSSGCPWVCSSHRETHSWSYIKVTKLWTDSNCFWAWTEELFLF